MTLGEKIRYLREVEGALRGLDREMTQQEVVRAIKKEQRRTKRDSGRVPPERSFRRRRLPGSPQSDYQPRSPL